MKSRKVRVVSVALVLVTLLTLAIGCAAPTLTKEKTPASTPTTVTITDTVGRVVEIPQPLNRVVVIYSQPMLIMRSLGIGGDMIVGLDEFTLGEYREVLPGLSRKPTVGRNAFDLDLERIIYLEPQVLIVTPTTLRRMPDLEAKLDLVGIKVVALDLGFQNVQDTIYTLGKMFGKDEEAEEYTEFWFSQLDIVEKRVKELKDEERIRVYWENTIEAYKTVSEESTPHELIEMAGGLNIAKDLTGSYPEVEPEWVIEQDPDVIIKYPMGAKYQGGFGKTETKPFEEMRNEIMERPGFDQIKAVREGRVYILSQIVKGGAFGNVGICYLAKLFYPELFADLDPEAYLKEMTEKYLGLNFEEVKGVFVYPCPWAK
jgi:iron complex transport system substrate-binding protein